VLTRLSGLPWPALEARSPAAWAPLEDDVRYLAQCLPIVPQHTINSGLAYRSPANAPIVPVRRWRIFIPSALSAPGGTAIRAIVWREGEGPKPSPLEVVQESAIVSQLIARPGGIADSVLEGWSMDSGEFLAADLLRYRGRWLFDLTLADRWTLLEQAWREMAAAEQLPRGWHLASPFASWTLGNPVTNSRRRLDAAYGQAEACIYEANPIIEIGVTGATGMVGMSGLSGNTGSLEPTGPGPTLPDPAHVDLDDGDRVRSGSTTRRVRRWWRR
jgi:hypothetical protein